MLQQTSAELKLLESMNSKLASRDALKIKYWLILTLAFFFLLP